MACGEIMGLTVEEGMRSSTHIIASKTAYLIGVCEHHFWDETKDNRCFFHEIYEEMDANKHARIIRNLSVLRTHILRSWKKINSAMKYNNTILENIDSELIPAACLKGLSADGIRLSSAKRLVDHLIEINILLQDRINNCKDLFPGWIKWEYLRDIFIMPNGRTEDGTKDASTAYYENKASYPFQLYINWDAWIDTNILNSDVKFLDLLYRTHGDTFKDTCRVMDISDNTRRKLDDFLQGAENTAVVVDCENANPYHLYAALYDLEDKFLGTVKKIILYNDVNTTVAWNFIGENLSIPVEHIMTERVLDRKSLVDITLAAGTCREFFQNHIDSFVLVSSDSDYWGLISALPEARFLVLMERSQCSPQMRQTLAEDETLYCFLEDFPLEISDKLREMAVYRELRKSFDAALDLNLSSLLSEILGNIRAGYPEAAEKELRAKIAKNIHLEVAPDGKLSIQFNQK